MIRGVVFDLGMTLLRFTGDWDQVIDIGHKDLAQVLGRHGLGSPQVFETFKERFEKSRHDRLIDHIERPTATMLQEVLRDCGLKELDAQVLDEALESFYRESEMKWVLSPGATDTLMRLGSAGYRLGLLSNAGDEGNVQRLINVNDLGEYFEVVVISASEGIRKPNPALFRKIAATWGFPAQSLVMIGDSLLQDIHGAQKAGMHQIWLYENIDNHQALRETSGIEPELAAARLTEIPALIQQMDGV